MAKQSSKDPFVRDIQAERKHLEKSLAAVSKPDMAIPRVVEIWSVKDILAHLVAWEKLFLMWYQAGIRDETPAINPVGMRRKEIDALNQQIYEKHQLRPLDEIWVEFHDSYQQILSTVLTIPENDLFSQGRYAWTGSLRVVDYVPGNTCNHYAWANTKMRKWLRVVAR
jgi:hypothetical protein